MSKRKSSKKVRNSRKQRWIMACPICGCEHFDVKNPDDEYEICEFDLRGGEVVFASEEEESWRPEITDGTVSYCDNCAWNGKLNELKK
ncbi:MAG: hypothetical protein U5R30_16085 [Deltaproteobacteria bacterium]|nr:hypothetical protein [Deltaproteobacteria bacterium]